MPQHLEGDSLFCDKACLCVCVRGEVSYFLAGPADIEGALMW